jgi:membrane-bound lytic murein transglycosylase B
MVQTARNQVADTIVRLGELRALGTRAVALGFVVFTAACTTTVASVDAHHAAHHPIPAPAPSADTAKFNAFLQEERAVALAAGISPATYDLATANIAPNPRIEQLEQSQPEFVTPVWTYLDNMVSDARIAKGQQMLAANAASLTAIESKYGVPKEILVAIWGAESNYGESMGTFNLFEALGTLAYDGPRQDYARPEFLAALKMVEQDHYRPADMTASWAGAFGQTQFVPSSFLAHAVDGDGDGKIDLWHDAADALASTANLLADAGWQRGNPCEVEVTLPAGFDYSLADSDSVKSLDAWKRLGVRAQMGSALPDTSEDAGVYLPAGARGPAFLVFDNFKVVLKYNNAASYALAVCTLAGRFRGAPPVIASWPRDEQPLMPDERIAFQTNLKALGYDPGSIDGVLGRGTRKALRAYQQAHGLPADGFPTKALLDRLMSDAAAKH